MLEIEGVMRKSLKRITKDSLEQYTTTKRQKWVLDWPGQVVLAVNQIHWTVEVE